MSVFVSIQASVQAGRYWLTFCSIHSSVTVFLSAPVCYQDKTNVGGEGSSFGIWHELIPFVKEVVTKFQLRVERIHTHIGSGSDPEVITFYRSF